MLWNVNLRIIKRQKSLTFIFFKKKTVASDLNGEMSYPKKTGKATVYAA